MVKNKFKDVDHDLLVAKLLPSLLNDHKWKTLKNEKYYDGEQSGHGYTSSRESLRHTYFENVAFYLTEFTHYSTATYLYPEGEVDKNYAEKNVELIVSIDNKEKSYKHYRGVSSLIEKLIQKKESEMSIVNYWVKNDVGRSHENHSNTLFHDIGVDSIHTKGTKPEGVDLNKLISGKYFWQPYNVETIIEDSSFNAKSPLERKALYYVLNNIVEKVAKESGPKFKKSNDLDKNIYWRKYPIFTGKKLFTPKDADNYIKALKKISSLRKSIPGKVNKLMKLPARKFEAQFS